MEQLLVFVLVFIAVKSMLVGSEFNFYYCFKYGSKYTKWYFSRETFNDFIKKY